MFASAAGAFALRGADSFKNYAEHLGATAEHIINQHLGRSSTWRCHVSRKHLHEQ